MGKYEKLIRKIVFGSSDKNIEFDELYNLLLKSGFQVRIKGSHHNFSKKGIIEKINIQKDGKLAKAYQVRQIRNIILKYKLLDGFINE
jgi:predicted RNA binding protein YcfA (HicA-like mRNA interferase family)